MVITAKHERFLMGREDPTLLLVVNTNKRATFINRLCPGQHRREDELCAIMEGRYRKDAELYERMLAQRNKDLHLQEMKYRSLRTYADELHGDYVLMFRVLREVFEDNENIRDAYADLIMFEGVLPTWLEDGDAVEEPLRVRRRLEF